MKHLQWLIVFSLNLFIGCVSNQENSYEYHFISPANVWEECLPLGNGRIGLMPNGNIHEENIYLNESSMWSGSREDTSNPEALKALPLIRQLLFEGKNDQAEELMYEKFVCGGAGSALGEGYKVPYGSYQIFGNLHIRTIDSLEKIDNYNRKLSLNQAISTLTYNIKGTQYIREYFTSFADDIAVIHLSSSKNTPLNIGLSLDRIEHSISETTPNSISIKGSLPDGKGGFGNNFYGEATVILKNGTMSQDASELIIHNAKELTILIGMATSYAGKNPEVTVKKQIAQAIKKDFRTLKKNHIQAYRKFFNRTEINLGDHPNKTLPIPERLKLFHETPEDLNLVALYYQLGRYLLISSTREGALPPNLQGIWCHTINTPWNGDYHLNINLQMNYWPAEQGNLSELHKSLIDWTKTQVESGKKTAKNFYNARGWVTHILGNLWQFTAPGEHPSWGATNTSAAWLCQHLYRHYRYSQDKIYLEEVYPVLREAALFFVDMLIEDPNNGYLVTAPTTSPENIYRMPNGKTASVCAGSTMDNQIIRELFTNTIEAAKILKKNDPIIPILNDKITRLKPTTIGEDGRIMEWMEAFEEVEPQHRHVSHLYGLYPGNELSVENTPDLAQAARASLEKRGDISTSWSMAWKINFWARLKDGEHAFKLIRELLRPCSVKGMTYEGYKSGTLPNLFSAHPPFQIDGNFGGAAGIAEMLLQSESGIIDILPALPSSWTKGSFKGLKIIGNATVDCIWEQNKINKLRIKAQSSFTHKMKIPNSLENSIPKLKGKGKIKKEKDYWILSLEPESIVSFSQ